MILPSLLSFSCKKCELSPGLVTQTISKHINHFRKSFHDKYQTRLRKVSKKACNWYYKYSDMALWNDIQILLL